MPSEELSTDQQRAVWFVDSSATVNEQRLVWKATTLSKEVKKMISSGAKLYAAFLAVMEELNVVKVPMFGFFTNSLAVANGLAIWSGRRVMEIWLIKGMPL